MLNKRISFGLEIFPPRDTQKQEQHWRAVEVFCQLGAKYISITCGAFGSAQTLTKEAGLKVGKMGGNPAIHLTCLGKTKQEIQELALDYKNCGFNKIIALRGDYPMNGSLESIRQAQAKKGVIHHANQMVEILADMGGFDISVACYPEVHPEAKSPVSDLEFLKAKLDSGAHRAITQFFLDPDVFLRFRDRAIKAGIKQPIIPGILPIFNIERVKQFAQKCHVQVPDFIYRLYKRVPPNTLDYRILAMNILSHQITRLILEGVEHFHFYTLNETSLNSHICHWINEGF